MLKFILGVIVGGMIGFFVTAILSINNTEKDEAQSTPVSKEIGDSDARSK